MSRNIFTWPRIHWESNKHSAIKALLELPGRGVSYRWAGVEKTVKELDGADYVTSGAKSASNAKRTL